MSHCVECGQEMHPADAAESLICGKCAKGKRAVKAFKVRRLSDRGAEESGRPCIPSLTLGGCPQELLDAMQGDDEVVRPEEEQ